MSVTSKDYFKSKGTFTNVDIPSLEGSETTELTANIAWSTEKITKLLEDYNRGLVDITKIHNTPFLNNDPNQRKPNIPYSYTREEIIELKKCASDIVYFGDKYCKLFTEEGYVNVKLRDYQQGILKGLSENNRSILLASRQIGKTTTTVIYLLWYLLFNREKNALVVGNKWRTSEEILDKIKKTLVALPFFMKPGIIKNNVHDMTFDNGCRIITTAPGKSAAIGFAINLLYMDEFAHIPSQFIGEFWRSVYPTVSSLKDSRIVISSTPNGQNMFYDMYMAALDGKSSFHAMRVDWWQVPGRDEKWKERTLSEFSQEYFNQEYNLQFFKGDNLLLDSNELKNLYSVKTKYVSRHISCLNVESMEYRDMERVTFYEDYSKYMTWHPSFLKKDFREELPDLKMSDDYFVLSIDTSKGQSDDYHILNVFKVSQMPIPMLYANRNNIINDTDIFTLVQVGKMRINTVNIETFANIVVSIAFDLFNSEKIYIALELNQQGKLVRNALERHADFWNGMIIYTKNSENGKFEPGIDLTGNKRKVELCEKFKHFVTTQRIIPTCEETYREVSNFGTNEKGTVYRCQTGHDDLAVTCIEASVFFDSFQYDDVAIDKVDRITDREYLRILNEDVIEYNRKRLGDDGSSINSDLVEFLNS